MIAYEQAVVVIYSLAVSYSVIGILFAAAFVFFGVQRIDESARNAGIGFRLLIFFGVASFWPLLLQKWLGSHRSGQES